MCSLNLGLLSQSRGWGGFDGEAFRPTSNHHHQTAKDWILQGEIFHLLTPNLHPVTANPPPPPGHTTLTVARAEVLPGGGEDRAGLDQRIRSAELNQVPCAPAGTVDGKHTHAHTLCRRVDGAGGPFKFE
jgi:hypothetical protein